MSITKQAMASKPNKNQRMSSDTYGTGTKTCPHLKHAPVFHCCSCGLHHHDHTGSMSTKSSIPDNIPYVLWICEVVKPGYEKISKHPCTMRPKQQEKYDKQQQQCQTNENLTGQQQIKSEKEQYPQSEKGQYPQSEEVQYPQSEEGQYPQLEKGQYPQSEEGQYPQSEEGQYTQSEEGQYPQSEEGQYPQSEKGQFPQSEEGQYPQSEEGPYQQLNVQKQIQSEKQQEIQSNVQQQFQIEGQQQLIEQSSQLNKQLSEQQDIEAKKFKLENQKLIRENQEMKQQLLQLQQQQQKQQEKQLKTSQTQSQNIDSSNQQSSTEMINKDKKKDKTVSLFGPTEQEADLSSFQDVKLNRQSVSESQTGTSTSKSMNVDHLACHEIKPKKQFLSENVARACATKPPKMRNGHSHKIEFRRTKKFTRKSELESLENNRKPLYIGNTDTPNALSITAGNSGYYMTKFKFLITIGRDRSENQHASKAVITSKKNENKNQLCIETDREKNAPSPGQRRLVLRPTKESSLLSNKNVPKMLNSNKDTPSLSNVKTEAVNHSNSVSSKTATPPSSLEKKDIGFKDKDEKKGSENKAESVSNISTAEVYHKAFQRLKQEQTQEGARCSSCGRAECSSENLLSMKKLLQSARENGYQVNDVTPDGNCMFAAIVDQLFMYGDNRYTAKSLRDAAVLWLLDNPYTESGTPKSEFLSEDWHHYIERMGREGEWGDHIILGAIVEVLGCTVRVMSPTESQPHWTTLEPQGSDSEGKDKHLILGHVGEFHYTSLRPTGSAFVSQESQSLTPRKTEKPDLSQKYDDSMVAVFRDTHICEESNIPVLHLTYLLKTIIPIACLDKAAIYMSETIDLLLTTFEIPDEGLLQFEPVGSLSEGIEIPELVNQKYPGQGQKNIPFRVLSIYNTFCVVAKETIQQYPDNTYFKLNEDNVSPGYTKLCPSLPRSVSRMFDSYGCHSDVSSKPNKCSFGVKPEPVSVYRKVCSMVVPCTCWPESALSWITRHRLEGWPPIEFIKSVVDEGCLISLGKQHKKYSTNAEVEYEFCFDLIEKRILKEVASKHQKHVLIMLRSLCQQTMVDLEKLSRPIKTIFFYACELIPSDQWASRQGSCVLYMLNQLDQGLSTGIIPDYFIPSKNVLDNLEPTDTEDQHSRICLLRSQPLLFLQQLQEACNLQIKGDAIIDSVSADIQNFVIHQSPQKSMVDAFVPATILIAKENIKKKKYKDGLSILSNAFEERLSVSTCNNAISYQMFLCGALADLDLQYSVWFAAYADSALTGQLSVSLVQELCAHSKMIKIKNVLPEDVAGEYAETEIPAYMCQNLGQFCLDYAKFMYCIEKIPAALPVLFYCKEKYKQQSERDGNLASTSNGVAVEDRVMLEVFVAILKIYIHQGKEGQFRIMIPEVESLCQRLNTKEAMGTFVIFCYQTGEKQRVQALVSNEEISEQVQIQSRMFNTWPEW